MSLPHSTQHQLRLCILLSDEQVQAQLLAVNSVGVVVKSRSSRKGYSSLDTAVLRVDECLRELGSESESVNEVIFGLQPDWVSGNTIAKSKMDLLHRITTDLSLQAVGFVVTTEAVLEYELLRNSNFSGSVCVVGTTQLFLLLSVQGSVIGVDQVKRSGSVAADMTEAIARLASHLQPGSRFPDSLLLASLDLADTQLKAFEQECVQMSWSAVEALGKVPAIRVIGEEEYALIIGTGAGRATDLPQENQPTVQEASTVLRDTEAVAVKPDGTTLDSEQQAPTPVATSFGIPISSDKLLAKPETKKAQALLAELEVDPEPKKRSFTHKHGVVIGVLGGVLALIISYVVGALFFASVTITITPALQTVSDTVEITLDPELTATDPQTKALAAQSVTQQVTGTDDILTTGVEIVGEKATGTVIIYNKVTAEKELAAGTELKAGELIFTLDEATTLPAAEEGKKETKYSETEVKVTAKAIGAEGNIAKETSFRVGDYSSSTYEGEAKEAFTGGSSREVRVVAEADRKALLDDLTTSLIAKASDELEANTPDGTYVIPPTGYKVIEAKYDAELKTEAERLSLTLTIEIASLSYTASDLRPIAQAVLSNKVSQGYTLLDTDPQILTSPEETTAVASGSAKVIQLEAQVTSQAQPEFDTAAIIASIQKLPIEQAQQRLASDARIKQTVITVEPSIFAPLVSSVPGSVERVSLVIQDTNK